MPNFFWEEVLAVAIKLEANGEQFYQHALDNTDQEPAKKLFRHLREEETKHREKYQALQAQAKGSWPDARLAGEAGEYLQALGEKILFPSLPTPADFGQVSTVFSAIRFAIQKELDSIYFYKEIRNLVPAQQQALVDEIIKEEQKHFMDLMKLEKTLR